MTNLRRSTYKSEKWKDAVRSLECCVMCGKYGVQVAHRNQGKGMGLKVDDCLTAALCPECHHEIDNGKQYTREDRRELMDNMILRTIVELVHRGIIGVKS